MAISSCISFLADAHTVDEGDEQGHEPEHQNHDSNVPGMNIYIDIWPVPINWIVSGTTR